MATACKNVKKKIAKRYGHTETETTETNGNAFFSSSQANQNSSHERVDRATLNRKLIVFVVFTGRVGFLV